MTIQEGSLEEYIGHHYYGYNSWYFGKTLELRLHHSPWKAYPIKAVDTDFKFEDVYPAQFLPFLYAEPHSVQLLDGSHVLMYPNRIL